MDHTELAWAAGFWDGEGSAYLTGARDRATRQPQARINQSSTTGVPQVLIRFQRAVGVGRVQGPEIDEGKEPLYRWVVSSRDEVRTVLLLMRPWLGQVKRTQLEQILGIRSKAALRVRRMSGSELLAWCAGLFDGEGSTYLAKHQSHSGYFLLEAAITQSSWDGIPEVLERFRDAFGIRKIYGPYPGGEGHAPVHRWKAHRRQQIGAIIAALGDELGQVKRDQAATAISVVAGQLPLPRGNPAWGNRKTHCVRGHEYATARIRSFKSRGRNIGPRRASQQCLACVRADAGAKRIARRAKNGGRRRRS